MADHYEVLGVDRDANAAEIRRAYLGRARALHPDRWTDRSEADRRKAERAMQDVNEAWRVLGDAGSRAKYDRPRPSSPPPRPGARPGSSASTPRPPRPPRRPVDGVAPEPVGAKPPGALASFVAAMAPYLILAAIGLGIFVVTAFAGGNDEPAESTPDVLTCVSIPASGVPTPVSCDGPNDGYLVAEVSRARACGEGRRYVIPGGDTALCLSDNPPPSLIE
ncbi:MAG: J domain-containing protein [Actinomycetota bacterium]